MVLIITPKAGNSSVHGDMRNDRLSYRHSGKHTYKEALAKFILSEKSSIALIDCSNSINQYLFPRERIEEIFGRLHIARVEQLYDLLDLIERLPFDSRFRQSSCLIIAGCSSLLEDADPQEQLYLTTKINILLKRLEEKYEKRVIIIDLSWSDSFSLLDNGRQQQQGYTAGNNIGVRRDNTTGGRRGNNFKDSYSCNVKSVEIVAE